VTTTGHPNKYRFSAAQALSLASTGIVASVLLVAVLVVWATMRRSTLGDAQIALNRSVRQLVSLTTNAIRNAELRFSRVADDANVRAALLSPDSTDVIAARAAVAKLGIRADSGLPMELWDAGGRRIASISAETSGSVRLDIPAETSEPSSNHDRGLDGLRIVDSAQIGELRRAGDRTLFWLVMPVRVNGKLLGFVASQRHIATGPQTEATIRELSGNSASGYYRNVDGSTWTTFGGFAASPPDSTVSPAVGSGERRRVGAGRVLYTEGPVTGTPLVIGMEAPRSAILAVPNTTAQQLAFLGAILTVVAGALTWFVGRRVMRSLTELTNVTDSIARGDYTARAPAEGPEDVVRLATSFNRMARQIGEDRKLLETANRAKSDFLASMSHELRTPLNAIGGYTELMEMGVRGPITEEQRRDLARIRASQSHLLGLISSLLDLTRIEAGQVEYAMDNVALDALLGGLEALVLPQTAAKQQTLVYQPCDPRLAAWGDGEKLRQILLNLLSNAVRYSPSGASITMRARRKDERTVSIEVSDTGPGIPFDRQRAIFEPFVQLDRSLTRSTNEGMGLGLSISRDLAHGMGGELTVTSAPGAGSCFELTLPVGAISDATPIVRSGAFSLPAVAAEPTGD
jgi:signal transduction histidine kinase